MTSVLVLFLTLFAAVAAETCRCNSAVAPEQSPTTLNNAAKQILSVAITLLNGAPAIPHQFALTTGAMFEAQRIARGRTQLTNVDVDLTDLSNDQAVGYAGYAALSRAFASNPDKSAALDAAVSEIGFGSEALRDTIGMPIAAAIAAKYPLNIPPMSYTPPNPPSDTKDARCRNIVHPDGWQPLCVTPLTGGPCVVQTVPFLPFVNASLITAGGRRRVRNLIKRVPPPSTFRKPLRRYPSIKNDFTTDYDRVLHVSAKLNDRRKIMAEVFAPNAALGVHRLALDEAAARGLSLSRSVRLFFAVSAAARDGFVASSTVKVMYSTVRPITVFQCGFRGRNVRAWRGPYQGVGNFTSRRRLQFRPYIQTPPFPGYVSGHSTIAGAAAMVLTKFFRGRRPKGANCFVVPRGGSVIEGKKKRGEQGFISGVTDVPNSGRATVGFTPASETTVCWNSFDEYAKLLSRSRLFGGIHIPVDNEIGLRLGRRAGKRAFKIVTKRMS